MYTLARYHLGGKAVVRIDTDKRLRGVPEGLFDGKVLWVSPAIKALLDDRSDADFWVRFLSRVTVESAPSLSQWLQARGNS